ncbi:MAG: hypothetical protein MJZ25_06080 [Fibrobacter sp.]|nr:hypothetical protein [Fibrobacter sp.]
MFNKKGVSLVTVLLFMLIATIAATATYKWLSTTQSSSASRMALAEAQQSSRAGLDAVRAWMTFNANDVGAIIGQYQSASNGKKPIKLNDVVKDFGTSKQNYTVWLTGVNTETSNYKLKITSVGTARSGNAKYSENSILKVNGLYRVNIPQESTSLNFDQAFSGKLGNVTSDNVLQSGLINGDLKGNVPKITDNLLVTGSVTYQGGTNQGKDLYIKGDYGNQGTLTIGEVDASGNCIAGKDTNVVYIGGNMTTCAGGPLTVCGDLFVNGNISSNCAMKVSGNLTVNGVFERSQNYNTVIGKNLVFTDKATLKVGSDNFGTIEVKGNAYFPKTIDAGCGGSCGDGNGNRRITIAGNVYQYSGTNQYELLTQKNNTPMRYGAFTQGSTQPQIDGSDDDRKNHRMFSFSAANLKTDPANQLSKWDNNDGVLKNIGNNYWERIRKMNAYGNLIASDGNVPQPLLLKDSTAWLGKLGNDACKNVGYDVPANNGLSSSNISAMNNCYKKLTSDSPENLYNGFLVLKINNTQLNDVGSQELDGKFVFYFDAKPSQMRLPPTKNDAVAMLYFAQGAATLQKGGNGSSYRYFIYSEADIDNFLDKLDIQGSAIMAKGSTFKDLNSGSFHFEKSVLTALVGAGIIKENPEYTKLANPNGSSSGDSGTTTSNAVRDSYHVATAPQLHISLESQYKNKELDPEKLSSNDYATPAPSIIVLPRVIYLTQDPVGRLSDYYSIINLNKATEEKNPSNVQCNPSLPSGKLYTEGSPIGEGLYKCTYTSSTYSADGIPFWVVIAGKNGETPKVYFNGTDEKITPGGSAITVNMGTSAGTRTGTKSVDVRVSNIPDEKWIITPQTGVSQHNISASTENDRYYTVTFDASRDNFPAFTVQALPGAASGTVVFELIPPNNGCVIGTPNYFMVSITGFANVNRADIPSSYCSDHDKVLGVDGVEYDCAAITSDNWPSCNSAQQKTEWVYPYCNSLRVNEENNSWTCGTNLGIHLQNRNISGSCIAVIRDTVLEAENNETYTLHASLKRKPYKLFVNITGNDVVGASTKVYINGETTAATPSDHVNGYDVYNVYAGYSVTAVADDGGSNKFSTWKCYGGDCGPRKSYGNKRFDDMGINSNDTLVAYFNVRDEHCFYDAFGKKENKKGVSEDFLDKCTAANYENCIDYCSETVSQCSVGEGIDQQANWMSVYSQGSKNSCIKYNRYGGCSDFERIYTYTKPNVTSAYISAGPSQPMVLLNYVDAGFNGTMTVKRTVSGGGFLGWDDTRDEVDDGVIFRSNESATSYFALNVVAFKIPFVGSFSAQAQVCYASGQNTTRTYCTSADIMKSSTSLFGAIPSSALNDCTIKLTLNGPVVEVALGYSEGSTKSIGIATLNLNDIEKLPAEGVALANTNNSANQRYHVGLKLKNAKYHYSDMSWTTTDVDKESSCFAAPQIYCSFRNKYIGGLVPYDSNVTPWVGYSSWFEDNDECEENVVPEYYYNGCDVPSSYFAGGSIAFTDGSRSYSCYSTDNVGAFWNEGARMAGSTYRFMEKGDHKVKITDQTGKWFEWLISTKKTGYAKNATAMIRCGHSIYTADCGTFYVGDVQSCTDNETIYSGETSKSCSGGLDCEINLDDDKTVNLRDANLVVSINSDATEGSISAHLVDQNGKNSNDFTISYANRGATVPIVNLMTEDGFDPQVVSKIVFNGSYRFDVVRVESSCPNATGIGNACYAGLNATGTGFNISAPSISHPEKAPQNGCKIESSSNLVDAVTTDCSMDGNFFVPATDLFTSLNYDEDISFTITMTDEKGEQSTCTTHPVEVKKPTMGDCSVSRSEIFEGQDIPTFTYNILDCPPSGCAVTVELDGPKTASGDITCATSGGNCSENWTPEVSSTDGAYTYRVTYNTDKCEASFVVNKTTPATAENCRVDGTDFKADLKAGNYGSYAAKLWYNDPQGKVIGSEHAVTVDETYTQSITGLTGNGTFYLVLTINGTQACDPVPYTVGKSTLTLGNCPTGKFSGTSATFTPSVNGCDGADGECSWAISNSGSVTDFANNGGSVTVTGSAGNSYVLSLKRGAEEASTKCTIEFESAESSELSCSFKDNSGTPVTSVMAGENVKLVSTTPNSSGSQKELTIQGPSVVWENGVQVNKQNSSCFWYNGASLDCGFTLPDSPQSYTYVLKDGSTTLCSANLNVVARGTGVTADCVIKQNGTEVTKVAGETSLTFDVSSINGINNNFNAKLNYGSTSKVIDCSNSNCWNNSFNAPAAKSDDETYDLILTTTDGSYEICRATLTVKGSNSEPVYTSFGTVVHTCCNSNGEYESQSAGGNMNANQWYSVTLNARHYDNAKLQVGYWAESPTSFGIEYTDCNGGSHSGTVYTKVDGTKENPAHWDFNSFDIYSKQNQNCVINVKIDASVYISINEW